jgi:zeaxanthin glucosyltransferase
MQPGHPVNAARSETGVLSMKLGFICPQAPGHLNPITALARQFQVRNHDVVFLYSSGATGLPFVPGPGEDDIHETVAAVSKLQGEEAFKFGISWLMTQTERILKSLPAIVQANRVDALVIDTVHFYAKLGAMQLGMPYIHVSAAMHNDYTGNTPLCHYDWPHQTTPAALARNREGVAKFTKILEGSSAGVRAHAESVGLEIDWENRSSTVSPLASITQVPRAFDFESFSLAFAVPPHGSIP